LLFRGSSRVPHPSGHNSSHSSSRARRSATSYARQESDAAQSRASVYRVGVHKRSHTGKSVSRSRKVLNEFRLFCSRAAPAIAMKVGSLAKSSRCARTSRHHRAAGEHRTRRSCALCPGSRRPLRDVVVSDLTAHDRPLTAFGSQEYCNSVAIYFSEGSLGDRLPEIVATDRTCPSPS